MIIAFSSKMADMAGKHLFVIVVAYCYSLYSSIFSPVNGMI